MPVYLNLKTHQIRWERPQGFDAERLIVGLKEFRQLVAAVLDDQLDQDTLRRIEPLVVGCHQYTLLTNPFSYFFNINSLLDSGINYQIIKFMNSLLNY